MNPETDHPQTKVDAPVLLVIAILITVLMQRFVPLPFLPSLPSRLIGAILFILGVFLGMPALRGMLKAKTSPNPHRPTNALVFEGTYRITRNPMYLSMLVIYAGISVFFQNPWFILFLPILAWLFTTWVIIPEEKYLEQKFGADYLNFKARVRRWI
ncbi:MAG: isoprenylcysteine carboxylmethyltransferase family protein [Anaerolineales bacterium]